jgi:hypothetical protein
MRKRKVKRLEIITETYQKMTFRKSTRRKSFCEVCNCEVHTLSKSLLSKNLEIEREEIDQFFLEKKIHPLENSKMICGKSLKKYLLTFFQNIQY